MAAQAIRSIKKLALGIDGGDSQSVSSRAFRCFGCSERACALKRYAIISMCLPDNRGFSVLPLQKLDANAFRTKDIERITHIRIADIIVRQTFYLELGA